MAHAKGPAEDELSNVSVEGRFGFGIDDDTVSVAGIDAKLEIDNFFGGYVLGHLPLADQASVYGLIGFTRGKGTISVPGFSESDTDSGLTWGTGFNFFAPPQLGVNAEYVQYLDESGYDLSAFSLGLTYNF
ncbi:porin family protein [Ectothiorhodosinus mongolicus]|uniref:porin family protein n=1 Tax=Ectothiorhodosinus mongolicus TaxID=233100 RepID=UPI0009774C7F|nr:porin family protein [Ectothiorhodosinus mongolicus]ULX57484.1 porin family protein [Ectothiorhodosinus mongolicus]